jgi:hypothetical protein
MKDRYIQQMHTLASCTNRMLDRMPGGMLHIKILFSVNVV